MNLLLDTHILIWWAEGSKRIGRHTRNAVERADASVWISAASAWEMALKWGNGNLRLKERPEEIMQRMLDHGFRSLPISIQHALAVHDLPAHHIDPFDRMLIAQALYEDLTLVTVDSAIKAYNVRTMDGYE